MGTTNTQRLPPNRHIGPTPCFCPANTRTYNNLPTSTAADTDQADNNLQQHQMEKTTFKKTTRVHGRRCTTVTTATPPIRHPRPRPPLRGHPLCLQHATKGATIWLDQSFFGLEPIRKETLSSAPSIITAPRSAVAARPPPKTIAQVLGSGRKVRKQKGHGPSRILSCAPMLGAKAHGRKNSTDYGRTKLNHHKVHRLSLGHAIDQKKVHEGNLVVWNQCYELPTHKKGGKILLPWDFSSALILEKILAMTTKMTMPLEPWCAFNLWMAAATFAVHQVRSDHDAAMYTISKHETLVLMLAAVERLESRLRGEVY